VANFRIWAPWRLAYVKDASKDNEDECIFCAKPAQEDDDANLIVHRGTHCFVILNLFPYTNGHLMVAPYGHIGRIQDLPAETTAEMMALAQRAMSRARGRRRGRSPAPSSRPSARRAGRGCRRP